MVIIQRVLCWKRTIEWDWVSPSPPSPPFNAFSPSLLQDEAEKREDLRAFFKSLSELRSKERSLRHGDFVPLHSDSSSLAYLRSWDQSKRYLAAFNWGTATVTLKLENTALPQTATVEVSANPEQLKPKSTVDLRALELGPGQAVLLEFPYVA